MEHSKEGFSRYVSNKRSAKENVGLLTEDTEKAECCSVLPMSSLAGFAFSIWKSLTNRRICRKAFPPGRGRLCIGSFDTCLV